METVRERIKEYALIIDESLDEDMLDFVVADVTDRALAYTNREQLIADYDENTPVYAQPIPVMLERALAYVVVGVFKNIDALNEGEMGVQRAKDGIQEVTFQSQIANYLTSTADADIFGQVSTLLNRYRLANVLELEEDDEDIA